MSIKSGYGNLTESLANAYLFGLPVTNSNRNAIIQLPSKQLKRIFSISVSYAVSGVNAANNVRGLFGGRLLVVGTKFDGVTEEIIPDQRTLPESLSSAQVYFDMFIGSKNKGAAQSSTGRDGVQNISEHFEFTNGIVIPESTDCSIILTYPLDDVDVGTTEYMASIDGINGYLSTLNVYGFVGGSDQIFKNVR